MPNLDTILAFGFNLSGLGAGAIILPIFVALSVRGNNFLGHVLASILLGYHVLGSALEAPAFARLQAKLFGEAKHIGKWQEKKKPDCGRKEWV
ncbi:hypothetical protein ASF73_12055 [Xanthomonas sp. Leaf131]|nr:hypothetical protein ASF73_12055 [Xanthomonas sp. Leaf131]